MEKMTKARTMKPLIAMFTKVMMMKMVVWGYLLCRVELGSFSLGPVTLNCMLSWLEWRF